MNAAPAPAVQPCAHCGAPTEGIGEVLYCCHGCEAAAAIIRGAGLERYYDRRESYAPRPDAVSRAAAWEQIPSSVQPDGTEQADLCIDGLRCAACVWVTEQVLADAPGVVSVRVSYADGRARLQWDPEQTSLSAALAQVAALGYAPRAPHAEPVRDDTLLTALGVAVFAAMNVMMLSVSVYLGWSSGMEARYAALFRWVNLVLATPVALWCARPFYQAALNGLRHGVLHMDLPVSLGVILLYSHGFIATWMGQDAYLDSMTMLVALLLGGRVIEQGGRRRAASAARTLSAQIPTSARRVLDAGLEEVAPDALKTGDRVRILAGETFAADGVVSAGQGTVQMSLVTGESAPLVTEDGMSVPAGATLLDGEIDLTVTAVGQQTTIAAMVRRLEQAIGRPTAPRITDRLAPWFVGLTLGAAALTFLLSAPSAGLDDALARTVAVLVVACPCALALAWPLAISVGMGSAARRGLILRSGAVLDELATVDVVALDKTGTVTGGRLAVCSADDATLRIAAGLERSSAHPIGRAIVAEATRRGVAIPQSHGIVEHPGLGIDGVVDDRRWRIRSAGPGRVAVEADDGLFGEIALHDRIRPDAARAIARMKDAGLEVVLLTGDHEDVAVRIAAQAGIPDVLAAMKPEEKADWIAARQRAGQRVLFVGDGLNDGPALAVADVGVAMGAGAASSVQAADAIVAAERLGPVAAGVSAARWSQRAIRKNLRRSISYNVGAVLAAAAGLVNPLVAAILMPLSSGMVLIGALSIERKMRRMENT
ncbi:MAG: heavy metal translocating P-type ATPase metal-binding domain-containing protein [Myxococcota bacterium]